MTRPDQSIPDPLGGIATNAGASRWHGIYPMLYAFFDDEGALDRQAFAQQIEWCIGQRVHGIAVLGLITEVSALSVRERRTLVEWAVDDIAGRVPLAVTIAGRDVPEQTAALDHAQRAGADCLVLQPPLGSRPDGPALLAFFSQVMQSATIPVGIQNAPEYLGVGLDPRQVATLKARHPLFELMKGEGPLVQVRPFVEALAGSLAIFNGRGGLELTDNLRAGCAGMIPAPDCADWQVQVFEAHRGGDIARADALYERLLPYVVFAMQTLDVAILYGKRGFIARAGLANEGRCRVPSRQADPFLTRTLAHHLARLDDPASGAGPAEDRR